VARQHVVSTEPEVEQAQPRESSNAELPYQRTLQQYATPQKEHREFREREFQPKPKFPALAMTSRDIETVLRLHMRQLETHETYVDDYYLYEFCERLGIPFDSLQVNLEKSIEALPVLTQRPASSYRDNANNTPQRGGRPRGDGTNPSQAPRTAGDTQAGGAGTAASPAFTGSQTKIVDLSHALGKVQAWTPKAPRKLVEVSSSKESSGVTDASGGAGGLGASSQWGKAVLKQSSVSVALLREDERVKVRALIERGYDILADLHDIEENQVTRSPVLIVDDKALKVAKKEETANAKYLTQKMIALNNIFELLDLREVGGGIMFLRMVLLVKGKMLIGKVLNLCVELLQATLSDVSSGNAQESDAFMRQFTKEMQNLQLISAGTDTAFSSVENKIVSIVAAVMVNLDVLSHESRKAEFGESCPDDVSREIFWVPMSNAILALESLDRMGAIISAFNTAHDINHSGAVSKEMEAYKSLVGGVSSKFGSFLLCSVLTRAFSISTSSAAKKTENIIAAASWKAVYARFCGAITDALEDIFAKAEDVGRMWELAALLDALTEKDLQARLRGTLKRLLDENKVPPPPMPQ